ncbi:hypothetical protein J6P68_01025 [bacterium]|nr:hypothetical protein [bacterium]
MTKIKSDQSQININQLNEYKELLKNFNLSKKEDFIKNHPEFKKKLKPQNFNSQKDYYEYLIFYFLYTNFKTNSQYEKDLKNLIKQITKNNKYLMQIDAVFYLLLVLSDKVDNQTCIEMNKLVLEFLIKNNLFSLFFSSKIWNKDYELFFNKIDLTIKQELFKNIYVLFKNNENYSIGFLQTLDFSFFLNNKEFSILKDILVDLNDYLNNNFQSLEKQKNILNRLNKIFNKLKTFSELISLFNEEEKELFSNILDRLKNYINQANLLNKKANNINKEQEKLINIKNNECEINSNIKKLNANTTNKFLSKIEDLSSNFLHLFNTPIIVKKRNDLNNNLYKNIKTQIINSFNECIKKEYEEKTILELLETLNFFEEYKQYLRPDFSSLISSNNIDHIKDYALIIAIFPRFESIILQLLKILLNKNKIVCIEEKASMINRIETITDFLKKEKYKNKEKYLNFLNFLKFCFYETAGFNLRNKYNHEENYKYTFN